MTALVTVDEAIAHLRLDHLSDVTSGDDDDGEYQELLRKMDDASTRVITHLKDNASPWVAGAMPGDIRAAILIVLAWMWRFRGDDEKAGPDPLAQGGAAWNLLNMHRDPALA